MVAQADRLEDTQPRAGLPELRSYLARMESGDVDIDLLQKLALFCMANPVSSPSSPTGTDYGYFGSPTPFASSSGSVPNLHADIWETDKNFDRLIKCLVQYVEPQKVRSLVHSIELF